MKIVHRLNTLYFDAFAIQDDKQRKNTTFFLRYNMLRIFLTQFCTLFKLLKICGEEFGK